jgi:hypothetical protein
MPMGRKRDRRSIKSQVLWLIEQGLIKQTEGSDERV